MIHKKAKGMNESRTSAGKKKMQRTSHSQFNFTIINKENVADFRSNNNLRMRKHDTRFVTTRLIKVKTKCLTCVKVYSIRIREFSYPEFWSLKISEDANGMRILFFNFLNEVTEMV